MDSGSVVSALQPSHSCSSSCISPICHGSAASALLSSRSDRSMRMAPSSDGSVRSRLPLRHSTRSDGSARHTTASSRVSSFPSHRSSSRASKRPSVCTASSSRTRQRTPLPVRSTVVALASVELEGKKGFHQRLDITQRLQMAWQGTSSKTEPFSAARFAFEQSAKSWFRHVQ